MLKIKNILSDARIVGPGLALIAAAALGSALTAQYGFGLRPCTLCLFQRGPYVIIFLLGIGVALLARGGKPKQASALTALAALTFLAGSVIAFYHHGVEQHWWASFLEGCKVELDTGGTNLLEQIMAAGPARCDEIPWADPVFHLSMAAWNMIVSGCMAVVTAVSALLIVRRANGF